MHKKQFLTAGIELGSASKVLIMLHGRGAGAGDILGLADHFAVEDFTLLAPQATNNTWYPYSFMAPATANEPWLSSAINMLSEIVGDLHARGIADKNIYFTGFSQGACLTLEFAARNARRYGGIAAFTGGLIGEKIDETKYAGSFDGTPVFIGTSDPDPHVPLQRVNESVAVLEAMNARVTEKIYRNMGHTINQDEIVAANTLVFGAGSKAS